MQVGAVEQRGGRVALGEGLSGHMRVPGDGTEEARRSRGRAVGGPQGKRRQLRQMGVKRRLRLRLRLAVHDGRSGGEERRALRRGDRRRRLNLSCSVEGEEGESMERKGLETASHSAGRGERSHGSIVSRAILSRGVAARRSNGKSIDRERGGRAWVRMRANAGERRRGKGKLKMLRCCHAS